MFFFSILHQKYGFCIFGVANFRKFFPNWFLELQAMLDTPDVDLEELVNWYEGWKLAFDPTVAVDKVIQEHVCFKKLAKY